MIVILSLIPWKCEKKTTDVKTTVKDVKIKIPEVQGGFESPKNFDQKPAIGDTVYITKTEYIRTQNPVDKKAIEDYKKAKDSLERLKMFIKSQEKKTFTTDYSDSNIELTVDTEVKGELLSQTPKYKIKSKEVTVQEKTIEKTITVEKKDMSGLIIGGGVGRNFDTRKDFYEGNAGVRFGKVTALVGYNTNNEGTVKLLIEL